MAKETIIIPPHVPPLPRENIWRRDLPRDAAFDWLAAGWRDLKINPAPSLIYGLLVCAISIAIVGGQKLEPAANKIDRRPVRVGRENLKRRVGRPHEPPRSESVVNGTDQAAEIGIRGMLFSQRVEGRNFDGHVLVASQRA